MLDIKKITRKRSLNQRIDVLLSASNFVIDFRIVKKFCTFQLACFDVLLEFLMSIMLLYYYNSYFFQNVYVFRRTSNRNSFVYVLAIGVYILRIKVLIKKSHTRILSGNDKIALHNATNNFRLFGKTSSLS